MGCQAPSRGEVCPAVRPLIRIRGQVELEWRALIALRRKVEAPGFILDLPDFFSTPRHINSIRVRCKVEEKSR